MNKKIVSALLLREQWPGNSNTCISWRGWMDRRSHWLENLQVMHSFRDRVVILLKKLLRQKAAK